MHKTIESPVVEPLKAIGLDAHVVQSLSKKHPTQMLQEWVDITLAARERFGPAFFKRSPAAFFIDNVKNAAAGKGLRPIGGTSFGGLKGKYGGRAARSRSERSITTSRHAALPKILTEAVQSQFEAAGQTKEGRRRNASSSPPHTPKLPTRMAKNVSNRSCSCSRNPASIPRMNVSFFPWQVPFAYRYSLDQYFGDRPPRDNGGPKSQTIPACYKVGRGAGATRPTRLRASCDATDTSARAYCDATDTCGRAKSRRPAS